jgi:hypothetical protein
VSVEALSIALHHSHAKGSALLMLIGIANHSGDGGAWPALSTLMKYGRVSDRRNAQRALRQLEQLGEIKTHIQGGGNEDMADGRRPNRYTFTLRCPADCDGSMQHRRRSEGLLFEPLDTGGAQAAPAPEQGRRTGRARGGAQAALTDHEPPTTKTEKNLSLVDVRVRACAHRWGSAGYCDVCGVRDDDPRVLAS